MPPAVQRVCERDGAHLHPPQGPPRGATGPGPPIQNIELLEELVQVGSGAPLDRSVGWPTCCSSGGGSTDGVPSTLSLMHAARVHDARPPSPHTALTMYRRNRLYRLSSYTISSRRQLVVTGKRAGSAVIWSKHRSKASKCGFGCRYTPELTQ